MLFEYYADKEKNELLNTKIDAFILKFLNEFANKNTAEFYTYIVLSAEVMLSVSLTIFE